MFVWSVEGIEVTQEDIDRAQAALSALGDLPREERAPTFAKLAKLWIEELTSAPTPIEKYHDATIARLREYEKQYPNCIREDVIREVRQMIEVRPVTP